MEPASDRIGKVNLGLAASLHPRMAAFDFQRLGFIRSSGTASTQSRELRSRIEELDRQATEVTRQKQECFQQLDVRFEATASGTLLRNRLAELDRLARDLENARLETEFALSHPDLTPPEETRRMLGEIDDEVMSLVQDMGREGKYRLILNTTIPVPFGFPISYRSGQAFGNGLRELDQQVLNGLLTRREEELDPQTPDERSRRWIRMTQRSEVQPLLPVRPWPLVLTGGDDITPEVIRRLYERHGVPASITAAVASAAVEYGFEIKH